MSEDAEGEPLSQLEEELRSYGISVESLDRSEEGIELEYVTAFPGEHVHHREMGRACNAFIDMAKHDQWRPEPVDATVLRAEGDALGTWHAEAEWFERLLDDDLTEVEFSRHVVDSLEEP